MGHRKHKPMLSDDLAKKLVDSRSINLAMQPGDGVGEALARAIKRASNVTPITNTSQLLRHIIFEYDRKSNAEQNEGAA